MIKDYSEKDYQEFEGIPNLNLGEVKSVKKHNMINSVQVPPTKRSSSSKTKSIGKYTTNKKKEDEQTGGQKYHTHVKARLTSA